MAGDGRDRDLLARLNALRPSSISLATDSSSVSSSRSTEQARPAQVVSKEDRLAERLKNLRASSATSLPSSSTSPFPSTSTTRVSSESDPSNIDTTNKTREMRAGQSLRSRIDGMTRPNATMSTDSDPRIESLLQKMRDEVSTGYQPDTRRHWQDDDFNFNGEEDASFDELVKHIGAEEDCQLDPDDTADIHKLLAEAREALSKEQTVDDDDEGGRA